MIFVTTGTHEQQFDRLVGVMDRVAADGGEPVFIQYGYYTRPPRHAQGEKLVNRERMESLIREARIIVTHGGPGSIWACFDEGKIPVVVPRQHRYGEHVNDHQVLFCRRLAASKRVMLVEDIAKLPGTIRRYDELVRECPTPQDYAQPARSAFCQKLSAILSGL